MQHPYQPFANAPAGRDNGTYVTTYGKSYPKFQTKEVSPLYNPSDYIYVPFDYSLYPGARDNSPRRPKLLYQPNSYYEEEILARQEKEREYRSRYEDYTLKRDEYMEPPPRNAGPYNYDDEVEYQSPRGRPRERGRSEMQMRDVERAEHMRTQYDDLVAQGQPMDPHDLKPVFCHNPDCFEDKKCMNRLGCGHQFCDACMANMPGSDGPFRDSIRWHYCCKICRKWTSEPKLVRTDPYGRRLMKFHDIGYFKTS